MRNTERLDVEKKGRCFADGVAGCRVLHEKRCGDCGFYKTAPQLEEERRRCARRLEGLGLRGRAALKYGGYGERP